MSLPSVSVILPNYNHANYLSQALTAILDQSVKPKEVIVIDDASTDNSIDIISKFANHNDSIKLILNEKNLGVIRSSFKGFEQATGDYMLWSAADDYLLPGFFEESLKLLVKYPQAGFCSSLSRRIDVNGDYLDTVPEPPYLSKSSCYIPPQMMREFMISKDNWGIMPSTVLLNRKLTVESKALTIDAGMYVDAFALRLLALKYGVCFIPKELGVYRLLSGSVSAKTRIEPKSHFELVAPMWKLMETTYADNFPPKLRRRLRRNHLYEYGAIATEKINRSWDEFSDHLQLSLDAPSVIDRLFCLGVRLLGKIQFLMAKGYLFLRLRCITGDIMIRIFNRYKINRRKEDG